MATKAADFSVTASGMEEVARNLKKLENRIQKKVTRGATAKAMRPVAKTAKANAKRIKDTGLLARSIGTKTKTMRGGTVITIVGPRKGFKTTVMRKDRDGNDKPVVSDPANYAHLVELGTRPHSTKKGVKNSIKVGGVRVYRDLHDMTHPGAKPKPFLRPALISHGQSSIRVFGHAMIEGMEREAKKLKVKR